MNVYCVSYDLLTGQDYSGLAEEFKSSPGYWHCLHSTWLIATSETAEQLFNRFRKHIGSRDAVLVIKVTNDWSGWLPEEAASWIGQHVINI